MYQRILLATDGSDTSELALAQALRLAKDQHAVLRVAYVIEAARLLASMPAEYPMDITPMIDALRDAGQQALAAAQARAQADGVTIETVLREDGEVPHGVAGVLIDEARASNADLLVLGTHGRSGVRHLLLGSVAEQVVRGAPVPVLLVRAKAA